MVQKRKKAVKRRVSAQQEASSAQEELHQPRDAQQFAENMLAASRLWQHICQRLSIGALKNTELSAGHSDLLHIQESFAQLLARMVSNPAQLYASNLTLMQRHLQLWQRTSDALLGKFSLDPAEIRDRRFKGDAWSQSGYHDYIRRSYLLNSEWLQEMVGSVPGMDSHTARKVGFFTRQFLDAISPSNFLMTNPEVLQTTLQSSGENVVKGLTQLLEDIERGDGRLRISMTDEQAFQLGENIAISPGQVVYENELMQLIQYAPSTSKVYQVPLLITPAWINKFYVLDLQEKNSLVKWLTDQGYTVFMISWANPDEHLAHKSFDDYLAEGPLAALDVIETITGSSQTSLIGYCLGGTLTSIALAYLRSQGRESRIASATFLTTMVDFTEAGDLSVFIDDAQLQSLENRMQDKGYLEASEMAGTFNMLRSNDLIWSFVVQNYLLGKEPFPFDLLYWNSDATRMPAAMHSFYLRNMYQRNLLIKPGGIELLGEPINITKIQTPAYLLSTKDDHIAPWQSTYAATQIYDGPVEFVLAESGHIAGVVSPPGKDKYGYYTNKELPARASDWQAGAQFYPRQSWWPHWHEWQQHYAGKKVSAPKASRHYPALEPAPGSYVRVRAA